MTQPNAAPQSNQPEMVTPDTVHALLMDVDGLVGKNTPHMVIGRYATFRESFQSTPSTIEVFQWPIEQAKDGLTARVRITPEEQQYSTDYSFRMTDEGMVLKRTIRADKDEFAPRQGVGAASSGSLGHHSNRLGTVDSALFDEDALGLNGVDEIEAQAVLQVLQAGMHNPNRRNSGEAVSDEWQKRSKAASWLRGVVHKLFGRS